MMISIHGYSQTCIQNTNSLLYNGSSSYVSFSNDNNLEITDSITVEAWVYATSWALNVYQGTIFCKHSWSAGEQGYVLRAGGTGQLSFNLAGIDTIGTILSWQDLVSPSNVLTLNTWYHVAGTFDGDSMRLFVNGVQVASRAMYGTIVPSTAFPQSIGKISDTGIAGQTRYWTGRLDEIRVWHRALNGAELDANRNHHIDPLTANNLVGYWRFNEGTGTNTVDLSTSGNDGTLSGATWITQVPFSQAAATPIIIPNGITMTCFPSGSGYQWNYISSGSTPIPNATQQVYVATQNGSYTVTITDSLGCTATSGPYIITGVVGILELAKDATVSVINTNGKLTVTFPDGTIIKQAILFDATGKTIQTSETGKTNTTAFATTALADGIYILQVNSAKGNYSTKIYLGK